MPLPRLLVDALTPTFSNGTSYVWVWNETCEYNLARRPTNNLVFNLWWSVGGQWWLIPPVLVLVAPCFACLAPFVFNFWNVAIMNDDQKKLTDAQFQATMLTTLISFLVLALSTFGLLAVWPVLFYPWISTMKNGVMKEVTHCLPMPYGHPSVPLTRFVTFFYILKLLWDLKRACTARHQIIGEESSSVVYRCTFLFCAPCLWCFKFAVHFVRLQNVIDFINQDRYKTWTVAKLMNTYTAWAIVPLVNRDEPALVYPWICINIISAGTWLKAFSFVSTPDTSDKSENMHFREVLLCSIFLSYVPQIVLGLIAVKTGAEVNEYIVFNTIACFLGTVESVQLLLCSQDEEDEDSVSESEEIEGQEARLVEARA